MKHHFQSNSLILCALELAIGIVLLAGSKGLSALIFLGAGILALAAGALQIIAYLRTDPFFASQQRRLSLGLALAGAGAFLIFRRGFIAGAFPALCLFNGLFCLVACFEKAQWFADQFRLKTGKWVLPAAGSGISLAAGILILCNPFPSQTVLWRFAGIVLVIVSLVDFAAVFKGAGRRKMPGADPGPGAGTGGRPPYPGGDTDPGFADGRPPYRGGAPGSVPSSAGKSPYVDAAPDSRSQTGLIPAPRRTASSGKADAFASRQRPPKTAGSSPQPASQPARKPASGEPPRARTPVEPRPQSQTSRPQPQPSGKPSQVSGKSPQPSGKPSQGSGKPPQTSGKPSQAPRSQTQTSRK